VEQVTRKLICQATSFLGYTITPGWCFLSCVLEMSFFFCMLYLLHFTSGPLLSVGGVSFGLWVALAWLTLPICVLKQVISVIQLIVACINTARLDESERERVNK